MYLKKLLKSVGEKYAHISVKGICFDSRKAFENDIFFAIEGTRTSGSKHIQQAISKKVSLVVYDKKININNSSIPLLKVPNARKALSEACSNFYNLKPSTIAAVTGTNGKSSVAHFFFQILNLNKIPAASIGTLGIISKKIKKNTQLTSLDPISLHKNLHILKSRKIDNTILEASSHGLQQKRLDFLNIKIGIFTNISHDHLDYHKSMKNYLQSKMHLFKNLLKKNSVIVTDQDNKEFKTIKKIANRKKIKIMTIGKKSGTIRIIENYYYENFQVVKINFNSKNFILKIPLIGYFQVKNLLMSILAALSCGLSLQKAFRAIDKIKPAEGRLECVATLANNSKVILDYAHTPDALKNSLYALKIHFRKNILLVFGCGGDRDKKKRFKMGKIAHSYCRKVFVTDDNPRNENPESIRKTIISSCKRSAVDIASRKKAIEKAIEELKRNEILLVAGKGHEKFQDFGKKIIKFSDRQVIKKIVRAKNKTLKKQGYHQNLAQQAFSKNNLKKINYSGVSIDTRTVQKNDLFFAINGGSKDGHNYVKEALNKGAIKSVVSKKINNVSSKHLIKVKNTLVALNNLAKVTRENSHAKIIGITGSVGKTTLKNLTGYALQNYGKVYQSPYSYNNRFGVPLSVSNLKQHSEFGIFEIGMSKKGEINELSKIIKPNAGIITNVSEAHLENFDNLKGIASAKSELIDNITENGNLILYKDDRFFKFFNSKAKNKKINVTTFSLKGKSDVCLKDIKRIRNFYRMKVLVKNKIYFFDTKFGYDNFIKNLLACISILLIFNLNLHKMKKLFVNFKIPEGRGDIQTVRNFKKNFKFIDESYNANPASVISAIKNLNNLKKTKKQKKLLFLGDMLELGENSKILHKSLSREINKTDIDKVFVYGKYSVETFNSLIEKKKGRIFDNLEQAKQYLAKILDNDDFLMIKGSNATGLNVFSKNLKMGK